MAKKRLKYADSIVLGLNDALVELTGALAGLTLALQDTRIIASAGLITGIAASLSMGASEYLSKKSENETAKSTKPFSAAIYTGTAYFLTVLFLVFPFLIFSEPYSALLATITNSLIIIFLFTFWTSKLTKQSFKRRFLEMLIISMGVALVSFAIGLLVRQFLGVDV